MQAAASTPLRWDLFCRVVDNFGDVGVCWRLARELCARGEQVRLWIDDASALVWMAPDAEATGVEVHGWHDSVDATPCDVVVEAFGCDLEAAFVQRMHRPKPPIWINLEYLSAEPYVERSHGLMSPQLSGPGAGLSKWFFYPGFSAKTGGLIRERDFGKRAAGFDRSAWLAAHGVSLRPGETTVCAFGYAGAPWAALPDALSATPHCLLVPPGHAQQSLRATALPATIRVVHLPYLAQSDFDHLLWSCDLNVVRGEDSLVRALWAGKPLLWQLYPQHDGAHAAKLKAFLDWYGASEVPGLMACWQRWNGLVGGPLVLPGLAAWRVAAVAACQRLQRDDDMVGSLQQFVASRMRHAG